MPSVTETKITYDFNRLYDWLGSFWKRVYCDPVFIKDIQSGRSLELAQLYLDFAENLKLNDRNNAPVFHRERWFPIIIRKSQKNTGDITSLRLSHDNHAQIGEQADPVYPDGFVFRMGGNIEYAGIETYPVQSSIKDIATCIVDNIISPKTVLRNGVDFTVDRNSIGILKSCSPFGSDSTFPAFELLDGDLEVVLWACNAEIDRDFINSHIAYAMGSSVESGTLGKSMINAAWNAVSGGATPRLLSELIAILCKLPYVLSDSETVQSVVTKQDVQHVITDKNVYTFPPSSVLRSAVTEGAVLHRGEMLDTAAVVYPYITDVSRISNMPEFDLERIKKDIPSLTIPSSITGTRKSYTVAWDEMSLSQFSETYDIPEETCGKYGITGTIIPIKFFLENLIGANTLIIVLDSSNIPEDAPVYNYMYFDFISRVIPSYVRLCVIEHRAGNDGDSYDLVNAGESTEKTAWLGKSDTFTIQAEDTFSVRLVPECGTL